MRFNILSTISSFLSRSLMPKSYILGSIGGALVGGGVSALGSILGGNAQADAARAAAEAARFAPPDITSGYGTTTYDQNTGFTSQLSPEYQALREQLLGAGQQGLQDFQTFDPMQAGQLFTSQLDQLAAPKEEQQRLSLENRLFKQGLLSSSTGADQTQAILEAQNLAQGQRNLTGLEFGQQQQERLFQNALGGIQGASALDALAANQIGQASAAGGRAAQAGATGANFQFQAAQNNADAMAGFFGNLGGTIGSMNFGGGDASGLFTQPMAGQTQAQMLAAQNAGLF